MEEEEVLGERLEVRALTVEVTLQCKILNENTDTEELAMTLKQQ